MVDFKYKLSVSALAGCALAVLFACTYHVGWVVREFSMEDVIFLLVLTLLVPLALIFIAAIKERIKTLVLFANAMLFVVSMYVVLINGVNYVLPKDMRLVLLVKVFYFTLLGTCITFTAIAQRELFRLARASGAWGLFFSCSLVIGGSLTALVVSLGNNGWFFHVIISALMLLSSLFLYLFTAKKPVLDQARLYHQKQVLETHVVKDKAKGVKIFLYSLLTILNLALVIGVNGMVLQEAAYSKVNWHFYLVFIIGGPAGIFTARVVFQDLHREKRSPEKEKQVQVGWLVLFFLQAVSLFTVYYLEIFVPGFHGSLQAQFVDGLAFSFVLSSFLMVILVLHPLRKSHVYYMLLVYFLCFGIAVGAALKGIAVLGDFTGELQVYFPYILVINATIFLVLVSLLVVTIFIRSMLSPSTRRRLKTGVAQR